MKGNPFRNPVARENSTLHFVTAGRLVPSDRFATSLDPLLFETHWSFRNLVKQSEFPCLGAKAAFNDEAYGFAVYPEIGAVNSTAGLCRDLFHFTRSKTLARSEYATFIAVFGEPRAVDEVQFEKLLWQQLHQLHDADSAHFDWDSRVSSDPQHPHFSFSFAGQSFYVIGMHANSSRAARRFPWPTLIFNPHEQFERLRTEGKWKRMQHAIRGREVALQGNVNPMLTEFGQQSEARQYSGRAVPDDWIPPVSLEDSGGKQTGKCPFGQ